MGTLRACPDKLTGILNHLLQYEVKAKSAYEPSGRSGWLYPGFCCIKQPRSNTLSQARAQT